MNKILITMLLLLTMISCNDDVTISKEEYKKLKGDTVKPEYPKPFHFKGEISYNWKINSGEDGHEYLRNDGFHEFVLIHYPDCIKCIKKDSLWRQN